MLTMLWDAKSNLPDKTEDLDELESNLQLHSFFYLLDNEQVAARVKLTPYYLALLMGHITVACEALAYFARIFTLF